MTDWRQQKKRSLNLNIVKTSKQDTKEKKKPQ